jgi:hypothetical protein
MKLKFIIESLKHDKMKQQGFRLATNMAYYSPQDASSDVRQYKKDGWVVKLVKDGDRYFIYYKEDYLANAGYGKK